MKYKNIVIILIVTLLGFFLYRMNILQFGNGLLNVLIISLMIACCSIGAIHIQTKIDHNYKENNVFYQNLDILKYIASILIVVLHVRPFLNVADQLDLVFNNVITRICVPIFFIITGYFVARKEKNNPNYMMDYIKRIIPTYLLWSMIYIPVILGTAIQYFSLINAYLSNMMLPMPLIIILFIILMPTVILIALVYTGVYYHLWYFPALILSLLIIKVWKKKWKISYLYCISFVLLLFGATETYYGILPISIKALVTYYFDIFFTTRNFLFFGLFYVVLGYYSGAKEKLYAKHCFGKLMISVFLLFIETILLKDTERLNSNILLSCVPLTYYLFISVIYMTNKMKTKFPFANLSKYYYLLHPLVIFIVSLLFKGLQKNPNLNFLLILMITHIISILIITYHHKKNKVLYNK